MTPSTVLSRRWIRSTRASVFKAFTDPYRLQQWLAPSPDVVTSVHEFDLRPGGVYRLGFRFPDGRTDFVVGSYREIVPDRRLIYTWTWEPPDPYAGVETLVTVELEDKEGGVEVRVRHERFPTAERRQIHDEGWAATLVALSRYLEQQEKLHD